MKETNKWKKRIILAGMMATITSLSLTGCGKKQKESDKHDTLVESEVDLSQAEIKDILKEKLGQKEYFVPWIALLEYEVNGEKIGKVVEATDMDENSITLNFITNPELKANFYNEKEISIYNENSKEIITASNIKIDTDLYAYVQQYCEFGECLNISKDTILEIEEGYKNKCPRTMENTLAQDANGKWKEYMGFYTIVACKNEENEPYALLMLMEENGKYKRVYRSLTQPEITLVETLDGDMTILKSELQTTFMLPEQNKKFTESNQVLCKIGGVDSLTQINYNMALELEDEYEQKLPKISDELTR